MKVLMVISQFHPIIGGAEKQAQILARKLMERGVTVDIVTGWWKSGTARKEKIDGIQVFRNFACWGMFGIGNNRTIRLFGGLIYMISLGIYILIHGREYDIIHVHQALYPAFLSALIGKKVLKKPVLVKSASSGKTSDIVLLRRLPFGRFQLDYILKETDYLVAVSKATGKDFKEIGYPESRISYIPNGVEIPIRAKTPSSEVRQVLTIARFSKEKGVDVLLKAWANVIQEDKSLKLAIVGNGPLEWNVKNLSHALEITNSIDFVGVVQNTSEYLKSADLFVLPSRSEGMSNALLEAMGRGIPCIATKVGGNTELLGAESMDIPPGQYIIAKNGLLVNPDDMEGLTEAMLFLIRNSKVREEMGKRGRIYIQENYSIDSIADEYIALYGRMLSERV